MSIIFVNASPPTHTRIRFLSRDVFDKLLLFIFQEKVIRIPHVYMYFRKLISSFKLKQEVEVTAYGEEGNHSLLFTMFRPGPPLKIETVPGRVDECFHELIKISYNAHATWRVIQQEEASNDGDVFVWPSEFCGSGGKVVPVLHVVGKDLKTNEVIHFCERRVAHISKEEGKKFLSANAYKSFKGGHVMIVFEKYLALGPDCWNVRIFLRDSKS